MKDIMKNNRKKGVLLALVMVITLLSQGIVCAFDSYEVNDTSATATPINWGYTYTADISSNNDVDYYKLATIPANATGQISFTTPNNIINYDLFVFDSTSNSLVASNTQLVTGAHTETLAFNHIAGHVYKVLVVATNGSSNTDSYSLIALLYT